MGGITMALLAVMLYWTHFKPQYSNALDEFGAVAINSARDAQACTNAYAASHQGQLPEGTQTKGEGNRLMVIGFQQQ